MITIRIVIMIITIMIVIIMPTVITKNYGIINDDNNNDKINDNDSD